MKNTIIILVVFFSMSIYGQKKINTDLQVDGDVTATSFIGDGTGITGLNIPTVIDDDTFATATATNVASAESIVAYISSTSSTLDESSTITTSRNALLTDADGMNVSTASSDVTITIPLNATVAFPVGTLLTYQRNDTGNVIIDYEVGVTGDATQTYALHDVIKLWKTSTDTWSVLSPNTAGGSESTTVSDTSEIDLTLSGSDVSGVLIASSIDETKLDASTNVSLDLADSALQSADIGVSVQGYSAVLQNTTASFLTADETKLDGIASGATVNDTDANLKARANHTGTQLASTISDFDTEVSNNTSVAANTAKTSNVTHVGEVTGSSVLVISSSSVDSDNIIDDTIQAVDLESTNAPTDNYVATYDSASGGFTWESQTVIGGDLSQSDIDTFAELDAIVADVTLINSNDLIPNIDTGTTIDMSGETLDNFTAASAATNFTMVNIAVGGEGAVLINGTTEPTVTGATKLPNTASWITGTDMILYVKDFNGIQKFYFIEF